MNLTECLSIMNIDKNQFISYDLFKLKKQYHLQALIKHPDKGGSDEDFKKLNEAYNNLNEILLSKLNNNNITHDNFDNYITLLMSIISNKNLKKEIYEKCVFFIKNIIKEFNTNYSHLFKELQTNIIELTPSLEDLFLNNIYKYNYENTFFLIPLWHNEIYFEYNKKNIVFICNPILPNNYYLDKDNMLHIYVEDKLTEISKNEYITIPIHNDNLKIPVEKLYIKEKQIYVFENKGISEINTVDIYNISHKMNIYIHINLLF